VIISIYHVFDRDGGEPLKISRKLLAAAKRRAFPWHRRVPREGTVAVEKALRFVASQRQAGATGTAIYRAYMDAFRTSRSGWTRTSRRC
jgi:hypothetical protein